MWRNPYCALFNSNISEFEFELSIPIFLRLTKFDQTSIYQPSRVFLCFCTNVFQPMCFNTNIYVEVSTPICSTDNLYLLGRCEHSNHIQCKRPTQTFKPHSMSMQSNVSNLCSMQSNAIQSNAIQCNPMQFNPMQSNAIQCKQPMYQPMQTIFTVQCNHILQFNAIILCRGANTTIYICRHQCIYQYQHIPIYTCQHQYILWGVNNNIFCW